MKTIGIPGGEALTHLAAAPPPAHKTLREKQSWFRLHYQGREIFTLAPAGRRQTSDGGGGEAGYRIGKT